MKMDPNLPCQALLLQPPPGDVTGPYPALCYLKSYAAGKGYRVKVKDLGIDALHYLSFPERVSGMLERVRRQCAKLEASTALDAARQQQYRLLLAALACADHPEWFADSIQTFRQRDAFFDYPRYKLARNGLNAFFGLLSALHYPTRLTPAEYPTATMLKSMDNIQAHQEPARNPYIDYYEAVLMPQIEAQRPALVGISMVFANQSVQALVLGRMIKARFPEIHVTLGGAYLSQWAMTADDVHVAQLLTCADSIVCGEGEEAFTDLLSRVLKNETPVGLPNLICLDAEAQQPIRFTQLNYTDITDQPPPDFTDLDLDAYLTPQTIIPYCVSRGCYWGRCVFCQNRYGDYRMRRYQTVAVDKAVDEMTRLAEHYGSNHFNFSNDVVDPAYLKQLSRTLLDRGCDFIWHTDLRAEKAFDAQTCALMARAGLTSVAIGFESGCQHTLDAMDKGKRVEVTAEVMGNLYRAGVVTQAMGIFGMPGESEADGAQTVHFLETNSDVISYYVMGLLMVLPGSRMHSDPQAYGVNGISYDRHPLKTPEPIWWSDTRMSPASVNFLYSRLSRLEAIYAIDEYPYVGGLSTNHGFLYYTLGPEILKRLRREEQAVMTRLHDLVEGQEPAAALKKLKKRVPRLRCPYHTYHSRFALHRLAVEADTEPPAAALTPGVEADFLLLPGACQPVPAMIGPGEISLLARIDGRRSMGSVLKKFDKSQLRRALSFISYLLQAEAVDF
jgi:anaerobic magnesium-protoporphyrin IX monomethyl ester cyclase